jgi:hypothetical protein
VGAVTPRTRYVVGFAALGTVGTVAAVLGYAALALLTVASRAEAQLAHLEDWLPEAWT